MDAPSYDQLLRENQQLRDLVVRLQARIDELERAAERQAAPFSKGPPKRRPKTMRNRGSSTCWTPDIPATNHRAEQALKTPIVNRKVWGGNRTDAGGEAQAVISSVLQTCANKAADAFTFVSNAFRGILMPLFA